MIPHGFQGISVPDHQGVGAELVRIGESIEFLRSHVGRIETGTGGLDAIPLYERLSVDAVPGAVVDLGVQLRGRIGKGGEQGLLVPEILLPVDIVHLVRGKAVQVQNLLSVVGDARKVRSGNRHHGIVLHQAGGLGPGLVARSGQDGEKNPCSCQFFHINLFGSKTIRKVNISLGINLLIKQKEARHNLYRAP